MELGGSRTISRGCFVCSPAPFVFRKGKACRVCTSSRTPAGTLDPDGHVGSPCPISEQGCTLPLSPGLRLTLATQASGRSRACCRAIEAGPGPRRCDCRQIFRYEPLSGWPYARVQRSESFDSEQGRNQSAVSGVDPG